jgi:hypothetical protein
MPARAKGNPRMPAALRRRTPAPLQRHVINGFGLDADSLTSAFTRTREIGQDYRPEPTAPRGSAVERTAPPARRRARTRKARRQLLRTTGRIG